MLNRIICSVVLMLFSVVSFIGCGFIRTKESVPVEKVGLVYVSENRPATVLIGVLGWHHNTCVDGDAKISADRDGKTIHLTATMRVYSGFGGCGDAVSDVYGEVTVRNLEVGEYKVMYGDRELLKFRIAEDAGYVKSGPIVEYLEFTMKTADGVEVFPRYYETSEPVQVTMGVVGYFDNKCVPYLKTHVERDNVWGNIFDIYVDISGEVPIVNTECTLMINPNKSHLDPSYSYYAEIDLGTLSVGQYKINVNDSGRASVTIRLKEVTEDGEDGT